jgi:hypothetical protein
MRFVAVAAMVALAGLAYGQESSEGWVRKLSEDGKSYVWTTRTRAAVAHPSCSSAAAKSSGSRLEKAC